MKHFLLYSVWFSPFKITHLTQYSKTPTDNSSMTKVTEKKTQWLALLFVVRVSESDINEADFTAVPSPLHFDLLDSRLLGWPVCLQKWGKGMGLVRS